MKNVPFLIIVLLSIFQIVAAGQSRATQFSVQYAPHLSQLTGVFNADFTWSHYAVAKVEYTITSGVALTGGLGFLLTGILLGCLF